MPRTLFLDLETFNAVDIKVGTYRYAETAEVLLFAYAFDDGPVKVWDRASGEPEPADLFEALQDDSVLLTAHNSLFDRTIMRLSLGIDTKIERWRCTMVKAYSHALPGSLEACGVVLGLPKDKAKLAEGKKLVHRFCKPAPKNHKADRYDRHSHPAEWERFKQYAVADIVAMRELDKRIPDWNWREKDIALYHLDQRINDRGFQVDQELTAAGVRAAHDEKGRMEAEFLTLTKGLLERPTQRDKFCEYLNRHYSLGLDNTRAETFRELLKRDDLEPDCRRLLELSIRFNKTSTAKYAALAPAVSSDGRFRGGLQFRGAARTRRWSGRNFQPQNLPSRGLPGHRSVDLYIDALKADCHEFLFDDLMLYGSAALRGVAVAPEGRSLAVADLSNIEGRIAAWLAGEQWKIKAFFDFDAGRGPDLYNVTATNILGGDPYNVPKDIRNAMGKVPELAFQYQGGYGACQTFARAYGVKFVDHWGTITANVDPELIAAARANYTKWGAEREPDADKDEWIASDVVKLAWRARHPKIVQLWKACAEAARLAIQNPGRAYRAGPRLQFAMRRHAGIPYLLMRLPSGSFLVYSEPRYHEDDDAITYMGIDATATGGQFGKWTRLYTYGGKFVENACQSLALDIMAANMPAIDASGFPIILSVHDELVTEPTDGGTGAELAALMSKAPEWLPDFPLAAAGFDATRYKKG